jgi:CheY-like chemotaxis protein
MQDSKLGEVMATILIVEEEPYVQTLYAEGLEGEGYETTTVDNFEEACRLLEHSSFDLVIINLGIADPRNSVYLEKFLDFECDLIILAHVDKQAPGADLQTRNSTAALM